MIIDASNLVLGRLATFAAKKSLLGERIDIVNCENAVVTGKKQSVLNSLKIKYKRGDPLKGPYLPRTSERFVRRTIRGMLPYDKDKGRKAFRRIMCFKGFPEKFKNQKIVSIESANISKLQNLKYVRVGEISKFLGK